MFELYIFIIGNDLKNELENLWPQSGPQAFVVTRSGVESGLEGACGGGSEPTAFTTGRRKKAEK